MQARSGVEHALSACGGRVVMSVRVGTAIADRPSAGADVDLIDVAVTSVPSRFQGR
jgi:hypothetical protein